jgi:hypothetical protein
MASPPPPRTRWSRVVVTPRLFIAWKEPQCDPQSVWTLVKINISTPPHPPGIETCFSWGPAHILVTILIVSARKCDSYLLPCVELDELAVGPPQQPMDVVCVYSRTYFTASLFYYCLQHMYGQQQPTVSPCREVCSGNSLQSRQAESLTLGYLSR